MILVTGANGFIGRHLVAALRAQGHETIGWTRADADLSDAAATSHALARIAPNTIFNLASSGVDPRFQQEEVVARDLAITANLIAAATPGTVFVQAGSMAEYGHPGRLSEGEACTPHTPYGRAKLASTLHALEHGRHLDVRVARIFGAWGSGEAPHRLLPNLVTKLSQHQPVDLSSGTQRRDFIYVGDACHALIALAEAPTAPPIVNIGTGAAIAVSDVCERIAALFGASPDLLRYGAVPGRATDETLLEADTSLLATLTEIPPQRFATATDAELRALLDTPN